MPVSRQRFDVDTDTGTWGDTGPAFWGGVLQMRWNPTTADTGADINIVLLPKEADTGDGFIILQKPDKLGADWVMAPYQATHDTGGGFTTAAAQPFVAAGDRLRVKVTPGGAACAGRLYVWIFDGH